MTTREVSRRQSFRRSSSSRQVRSVSSRSAFPVCFAGRAREDFMIEVGANAPDFTLRSHSGEEVTLSQFRGDKWVVLHTFPLAFTGG